MYQVAAYQTSQAAIGQTGAGIPFPGLAYAMFVEGDGTVYWAWDFNVRTWHNAADNHNGTHIGICYAGDHAPNAGQIVGMGRAIGWLQRRLGKLLIVEGHKDHYATSCPGPMWPQWKQRVLDNIY